MELADSDLNSISKPHQSLYLEDGETGQSKSLNGTTIKQDPSISLSGTIGDPRQAQKASKPTGPQRGETGVAVKSSVPMVGLEEASALAQRKETLLEHSKQLEQLLELPAATPENLTATLEKISSYQLIADAAEGWAVDLLAAGGSRDNVAEVGKLMMHYPTQFATDGIQGEGLALMRAIKGQVMQDWAEDIQEYPTWAIQEACKVWRRGAKGMFRPSIADIRALADTAIYPYVYERNKAKRAIEAALLKAKYEAYCEEERRKRWPKIS